jgi:hypothetical protein
MVLGLLTEIVLTLLRSGNIDRLELGPTMCEEDGLNLHSSNVLRGKALGNISLLQA